MISRAASRGRFSVAGSASGSAGGVHRRVHVAGIEAMTPTPCGASSSCQMRLM